MAEPWNKLDAELADTIEARHVARGTFRRPSEDADAYPVDDPKHPDYHDTMSDLWDMRDHDA